MCGVGGCVFVCVVCFCVVLSVCVWCVYLCMVCFVCVGVLFVFVVGVCLCVVGVCCVENFIYKVFFMV